MTQNWPKLLGLVRTNQAQTKRLTKNARFAILVL